jgi:group I intron endonuclease
MTKQEKYYNFVYITTNLITGKQYIGDHSCDKLEKDSYLGSGLYLRRALKEYGKENFKKEILEFFNSKQEAFNAQEKYINEYNTLAPNGYNISPKGGHNVKDCISEETKIKISNKSKINSAGEKNGMFGKKHSEQTKLMWSLSRKGIKHSEKTKQKMSKTRKGIKFSEEHKNNMSKSFLGEGNSMYGKHGKDNPNYGSKRTEDSKKKMRGRIKSEKELQIIKDTNKKMRKTCEYCNKNVDHMNYKKWHGNNCKNKILK